MDDQKPFFPRFQTYGKKAPGGLWGRVAPDSTLATFIGITNCIDGSPNHTFLLLMVWLTTRTDFFFTNFYVRWSALQRIQMSFVAFSPSVSLKIPWWPKMASPTTRMASRSGFETIPSVLTHGNPYNGQCRGRPMGAWHAGTSWIVFVSLVLRCSWIRTGTWPPESSPSKKKQ